MQSNVELKQQLAVRSIPIGTVAALASTAQSRIFPTDLSHFFKGRAIAPAKADVIRKACETLIGLSDSLRVQPDWRNVDNVREAARLLADARQHPAQAPWQFRGATATPEDFASASTIARETLAGASEKS